jgi:leader peptidase (prepilin peptidase)/N-methyltransferase
MPDSRRGVLERLGEIDGAGWTLLLLSPIAGSFAGVLIRRLPDGMPIIRDRSRCDECGTVLQARDLVPLASWLASRGRCRHCGASLGWFYPAVEVAAIGIALISLAVDTGTDAWLDTLLGIWLLTLGSIDLRRWVLPDVLTLPLAAVGIAAAVLRAPADLADRGLGMVLGYIGLRAVAWLYRQWRGREGLGGGDAKLLAAAGAWTGATGLPSIIFGGAVLGLIAAGAMALAGHALRRDSALPFGPFLALTAWLVWLFGPFA